jgi:hypothetical protein
MTRVVNIKHSTCDIYIGRYNAYYGYQRSKFANPFEIGRHGGRDKVLDLYEEYLDKNPQLIEDAVKELDNKVLGCWCYPQSCHGDILIRKIEQWKKQNQLDI